MKRIDYKMKIMDKTKNIFHSEKEWLSDKFYFKITKKELKNVDEDGFIISRCGYNCYLLKEKTV